MDRIHQVYAQRRYSVETLVKYVTLLQQDETIEARRQIHRATGETSFRIEEMKRALERLNFKIEEYESKLIPAESKLKDWHITSSL